MNFTDRNASVGAVEGVLKGFDALLNLVLDDAIEHLRGIFLLKTILTLLCFSLLRSCRHNALDPEDPFTLTDETRSLGLLVCRGSAVMLIMPLEGTQEIANPFNAEADAQKI